LGLGDEFVSNRHHHTTGDQYRYIFMGETVQELFRLLLTSNC